ncbi:hypothetical protein SK128_026725 [Halocaridina rubra]|uniref:Uncharacterized protein n=1 Tax=Halocaridina rubra TaxID=373956 RepID=A0AAN8XGB0_HALRR
MEKESIYAFGGIIKKQLKTNPENVGALLRRFNGKNSYEDIFTAIWDIEEAHRVLTPKLLTCEKSDTKANDLRNDGNTYYKRKDYEKALKLYSLSIMNAPHPRINGNMISDNTFERQDKSFECPPVDISRYGGDAVGNGKALSLGFANRSAVLFELHLYEKCMRDIDLAVQYGYPTEHRQKLDERKRKCQIAIKNGETNIAGVSTPLPSSSIQDLLRYETPEPKMLLRSNVKYPSLSSAVDVVHNVLKGRSLMARRDIHSAFGSRSVSSRDGQVDRQDQRGIAEDYDICN